MRRSSGRGTSREGCDGTFVEGAGAPRRVVPRFVQGDASDHRDSATACAATVCAESREPGAASAGAGPAAVSGPSGRRQRQRAGDIPRPLRLWGARLVFAARASDYATGLNFGNAIVSVISSNTTSTGIPTRTAAGSG